MLGLFDTMMKSIIFLISFISGNNSFPKPLSAKEEQEYIKRMMNGDIDAKNALIEHNLRLVVHIAKKYSAGIRDNEDLISLGTIGLIKGINSFDASKGTRLATYAARCIENEILMLMRANKKTQGDVSLNDPIGVDKEGNQILLMDIIGADEEDVIREIDTREQIKKLYSNIATFLDEREREIIRLRYGLDDGKEWTQSEIAKVMNISRSYVSRIEKKAIEKLKIGICE
jgi:RNA polymerase sporulation-specific sigma factor